MDFLRLATWTSFRAAEHTGLHAPAGGYEDLGTVLHDAHLRRDVARRPDLTPFVREEPLDRAA